MQRWNSATNRLSITKFEGTFNVLAHVQTVQELHTSGGNIDFFTVSWNMQVNLEVRKVAARGIRLKLGRSFDSLKCIKREESSPLDRFIIDRQNFLTRRKTKRKKPGVNHNTRLKRTTINSLSEKQEIVESIFSYDVSFKRTNMAREPIWRVLIRNSFRFNLT